MESNVNTELKQKLENILFRLKSSDSDERRWVIYDLGAFEAIAVIDILVEGIQDDNRAVREAASEILESLEPEVCTGKLTPLLGSERIEVRNITASVLVKYGQSAVKDLILALVDPNEDVRKFSADILGLARNSEAVPNLCQSALEDEVSNVAVSAVEALGKIGDPGALPALYKLFDRNRGLEPEVVEAIGLIGQEESVKFLTDRLEQEDPVITFAIIDAFGNLGQASALASLYKFMDTAPDFLRDHICLAILKIGQSANHLVLDEQQVQFMESVFEALTTVEEEVIALVLHQFTLQPNNPTIAEFFNKIETLPSNVIVGLIRHAKGYAGYADALLKLVNHEDDWVAYSALESFDNIPLEQAQPVLLSILKNFSGLRLLAAMRSVELFELKEALDILQILATDEQEEIRTEAQRILDNWSKDR